MITLTEKEEKGFQIAKVCKICLLSIEENELYKVRDHCHITKVAPRFSTKFVDKFRFIASSLSELAENLFEGKSRFRETLKLFSMNILIVGVN
ncbi:Uncharacterized protein FWK35_00033638 [Aphis craccivora]|uniref:Uncharacterized protein n=1 Tax=Aphis craccivora TaxID=307492 RepID=A0A6G0W0N7_APHCR|nr:Uncharacterized protein FWK35_00033638 [Aphis craccivora]